MANMAAVKDVKEHPNAPEIRRQVEYYFSDENLPTDLHLLQLCGGRQNLPVSVNRICGWRKMRTFKPKSMVVEALRKSPFLVVSADGKNVQRKDAFQGPCVIDGDGYDDEEIAYDPRTTKPKPEPVKPALVQKKYPLGMSKNMMKPSGFEDSYTEPPIAAEEAAEEEALYHPDKPFVVRIEVAIQRFTQRRRMHQKYAEIFNKWMQFGGVESSQRMFGGISRQDLVGMDAEEITKATGIHKVPSDRADTTKWVVDFVGVAEAFLSFILPAQFSLSPEQVKTACQVFRSFFNYLLAHHVCDEYRADVETACKLCDVAQDELAKINAAGPLLPGTFNSAASTIFGGSKVGTRIRDQVWAMDPDEKGNGVSDKGLTHKEALSVFKTGVVILGTNEQQIMLKIQDVKILKTKSCGLEVTSLTQSDDLTKEMYSHRNKTAAQRLQLEPLGKLRCRIWDIPTFNPYDLPKAKYPDGRPIEDTEHRDYEFWVEDSVLANCYVGMRMDATMLTLNGGIIILDNVKEVMCSFYKWIPNDLWMETTPKEVVLKGSTVGLNHQRSAEGSDGDTFGKDDDSSDEDFIDNESDFVL